MNFQALYLMDLSFYPFLSLFHSLSRSLCLFRYSPDAFAVANGPLVRFLCLFCFFFIAWHLVRIPFIVCVPTFYETNTMYVYCIWYG